MFRRRHRDTDLDHDIQAHLDLLAAQHERRGLSPQAAQEAARRDFGGVLQVKERYASQRGSSGVGDLLRDMRHAVRAMRRASGFTVATVTTLALAIGASTTTFALLDAVMLRGLPYPAPEQLVLMRTATGRPGFATVEEWRRQSRSFQDVAIFDPVSATVRDDSGTTRADVARVSANLFDVLGMRPLRGRMFSAAEADRGERVAVISYDFWQSQFGGADAAVGAALDIDGRRTQVIGIVAPGRDIPNMPSSGEIWEPYTLYPDWNVRRTIRGPGEWLVIARLRDAVEPQEAQREMTALASALDEELPATDRSGGVEVLPLADYVVTSGQRLVVWVLMGAACCVLLIGIANVTSLSVARAMSRADELATRSALGASLGRIMRLLVIESAVLGVVSGALGLALAAVAIRALRVIIGSGMPLAELRIDADVWGWAFGVALVSGVLIGLVPAAAVAARGAGQLNRVRRESAGGVVTRRIRRALVAGEIALAVVLLVGAGLLARSWLLLNRVDMGFDPRGVLSLNVSTSGLAASQRVAFYDQVLAAVSALPGVRSAGFIGDFFISGDVDVPVTTEGAGTRTAGSRLRLRVDEVSDRFFQAVGSTLIGGRLFSSRDRADSVPVVIVNEAMARQLWPERDPVGLRFKFGTPDSDRPWLQVVGVVADMRRQGAGLPAMPQVFAPLVQRPSANETLLVRTGLDDPLRVRSSVQAAMASINAAVAVYGIATLEQQLALRQRQRDLQTMVLMLFSAMALVVAAVGVYGLVHYSVSTMTHELAIRMALGADRRTVFRFVAGEGLKVTIVGLAIGIAGALWLGDAIAGLLFGIRSTDLLTFAAVCGMLTCVAAAASYFPARRAIDVEPAAALR